MKTKFLPVLVLPALLAACGTGSNGHTPAEPAKEVTKQVYKPAEKTVTVNAEQGAAYTVGVKLKAEGEKVEKPTKAVFTKTITVKFKEALAQEAGFDVKVGYRSGGVDAVTSKSIATQTAKVGDKEIVIQTNTTFNEASVVEMFNNPEVSLLLGGVSEGDVVTFDTEVELQK